MCVYGEPDPWPKYFYPDNIIPPPTPSLPPSSSFCPVWKYLTPDSVRFYQFGNVLMCGWTHFEPISNIFIAQRWLYVLLIYFVNARNNDVKHVRSFWRTKYLFDQVAHLRCAVCNNSTGLFDPFPAMSFSPAQQKYRCPSCAVID